jgi:hypothetical protein
LKRDFDLIRDILLQIEAAPANSRRFRIRIPEKDQDVVDEHVELLIESGLVDGAPRHVSGAPMYVEIEVMVTRLTWEGHDFLSSMRDDTIWRKAKTEIIKPGLSFTFSLLAEWLKTEAKSKLGIP